MSIKEDPHNKITFNLVRKEKFEHFYEFMKSNGLMKARKMLFDMPESQDEESSDQELSDQELSYQESSDQELSDQESSDQEHNNHETTNLAGMNSFSRFDIYAKEDINSETWFNQLISHYIDQKDLQLNSNGSKYIVMRYFNHRIEQRLKIYGVYSSLDSARKIACLLAIRAYGAFFGKLNDSHASWLDIYNLIDQYCPWSPEKGPQSYDQIIYSVSLIKD